MFPNLVIYHEFRDFGVSLRDRNFPSVRSPESLKVRDFREFQKFCDFSAILSFLARDFRDILAQSW